MANCQPMLTFIVLVWFSIITQSSAITFEIHSAFPFLSSKSPKSLKYVALVSRHGSRSPLSTFPTDLHPYTDRKYWPDGPEGLTNLGKRQLYHTGQLLKKRYNGFLNPIYNIEESEVTYNPYTRDFMSAACLTAGMYPPEGVQVWNKALRWQPVFQSQRNFDICDLASTDDCPRYKQIYNALEIKFNGDTDKHKQLLEYVSANAGKNYTKLSEMYDVYDTLLMQEQNGYTLPEWTKKVFPTKLRPFATSFLNQGYAGDKELIQLGAGPELKYIGDSMTKKANGTYSSVKKFYIEAAHDCTLIALLRALGNNDSNLEIQTGAFLLFELHYLEPDYIVKTLYFKTSYDKNPDIVNIKDCPNPCSLKNFNKFVDGINPPDWKKACIMQ